MAVPKKRRSKSQKRMRKANWKITLPNLSGCSNCAALVRSHRVCPECGYYKGKPVIQIKEKKAEKKES